MGVELIKTQSDAIKIYTSADLRYGDIVDDLNQLFSLSTLRSGAVYVSETAGGLAIRTSMVRPDITVGVNAYRDFVQPEIKGKLEVTVCVSSMARGIVRQTDKTRWLRQIRPSGISESLQGNAPTYPGRIEAISHGVAMLGGIPMDTARDLVTSHYGLRAIAPLGALEALRMAWSEMLVLDTAVEAARVAMLYASRIR
jgi:hypothetical protein